MTDIGHAATNKHFVNGCAGHIRHCFYVVRIVRACHDGLVNVGQVNFNDCGILRVGIGLQQLGVLKPRFHGLDAAANGAFIFITIGNHPFQHGDVAIDVFNNRFFVQVHGTTGSRTLGRRIGQFKSLFHFQLGQAFNFQDTA